MLNRGDAPNEKCPYCGRQMYRVVEREHPGLEAHLCYACGGCIVYEVAPTRVTPRAKGPR